MAADRSTAAAALQPCDEKARPMFSDFRGISCLLSDLRGEVVTPLLQWKLLRHLGVEPVTRILLHGPPGSGKTKLARAVANEAGLSLFEISAARLVSQVSGAAEEKIRELFSTAYKRAPSVVFIDELDAMTSKTGSLLKEIELRIVKQLIAYMDEPCGLVNRDAISESCNSRPGYVLVIGATNSPDSLDPALRRQFDREFALRVIISDQRLDILSALTRNLKVKVGFDLKRIAMCTDGYVAGDLVALAKKAGRLAVDRIMRKRILESDKVQRVGVQVEDRYKHQFNEEEFEHCSITMDDFVGAIKMVQPSAKMESFFTIPNVKWDDVGGLQSLKLKFERLIVKTIKYPEVYADLEDIMNSFFLYGPSGCGKTLIVEALAKETGATLMHMRGGDLLTYGDQSELVVHNILRHASTHTPCVVFFDELEGLTSCDDGERWHTYPKKLISVLSEMDTYFEGVFVIAATNRPEIVSDLVWSQFGRTVYVPLPSPEERGAILKALGRRKPVDAAVDLMALGKAVACENFNGTDLCNLMIEASEFAFNRPSLSDESRMTIKDEDFKRALAKISPSLSSKEIKNWKIQSAMLPIHYW